jgi:hypothetical protein
MGLKSTTVCLGYQQITSLSSATGLTIPQGTTLALIVPETQNVRWRDDGTDPTASVGMPIFVGASLSYDGDLNRIKFIESTAGATLNICYYA